MHTPHSSDEFQLPFLRLSQTKRIPLYLMVGTTVTTAAIMIKMQASHTLVRLPPNSGLLHSAWQTHQGESWGQFIQASAGVERYP